MCRGYGSTPVILLFTSFFITNCKKLAILGGPLKISLWAVDWKHCVIMRKQVFNTVLLQVLNILEWMRHEFQQYNQRTNYVMGFMTQQ